MLRRRPGRPPARACPAGRSGPRRRPAPGPGRSRGRRRAPIRLDAVVLVAQAHLDASGAGVLDGVGQRLLGDAQQLAARRAAGSGRRRPLDLPGARRRRARRRAPDQLRPAPAARSAVAAAAARADPRRTAGSPPGWRPPPARCLQISRAIASGGAGRPSGRSACAGPQLHQHRRHPLQQRVVQLARHPGALGERGRVLRRAAGPRASGRTPAPAPSTRQRQQAVEPGRPVEVRAPASAPGCRPPRSRRRRRCCPAPGSGSAPAGCWCSRPPAACRPRPSAASKPSSR